MNIGIIGAGVVGTATGKVLSKKHKVVYFDKYKKEYSSGWYSMLLNDIVIICVPTPMKIDGSCDTNEVAKTLYSLCNDGFKRIVVIKSTIPIGQTRIYSSMYDFEIVFNPEFLTEKNADADMKNSNRIVLGGSSGYVRNKVAEMYKKVFPKAKYILCGSDTAEAIKLFANTFLACQVGIANEMYQISKKLDVPYDLIKDTILMDDRIGKNISVPGHDGKLGFGGKCFPKDLNGLIYQIRGMGYRPYLLEEVWRLNQEVREEME